MPEFDTAIFLGNNIDVSLYNDVLHYQKIFCPECKKAPLHIVRKQHINPYFASNRKEDHHEDCQHFKELISHQNLIKLVKSETLIDKKRLKFLIQSNLTSALRLLLKDEDNSNTISKTKLVPSVDTDTIKLGKTNLNENILRISIKKIKRATDYLEKYVVIYGHAQLETKTLNNINSKTNEKFTTKHLTFRVENKFKFSISLTSNQSKYFNDSQYQKNISFAAFGKIEIRKSFLSLKLLTHDNLIIVQ